MDFDLAYEMSLQGCNNLDCLDGIEGLRSSLGPPRVVTEEHTVEVSVSDCQRSTDLSDYTFSTVYRDGLWIATASRRGTTETISVCFEGQYGPGDAAIIGISKLKRELTIS